MAKLGIKPSKYMLNLNYYLAPYADKDNNIINIVIENMGGSINKYEGIFETGQLKLDRVSTPPMLPVTDMAYGEITGTMDEDGDQLDVILLNLKESIVPGTVVEARVIGIMKFIDGDEVDDKVLAVVNDDKRSSHITNFEYFGEYTKKELQHYFENYKKLRKPNANCVVKGFFDAAEAIKIIDECVDRFEKEIRPQFE